MRMETLTSTPCVWPSRRCNCVVALSLCSMLLDPVFIFPAHIDFLILCLLSPCWYTLLTMTSRSCVWCHRVDIHCRHWLPDPVSAVTVLIYTADTDFLNLCWYTPQTTLSRSCFWCQWVDIHCKRRFPDPVSEVTVFIYTTGGVFVIPFLMSVCWYALQTET